MISGYQSDTGVIQHLVMKHARDAFGDDSIIDGQWQSLNYHSRPDLARAIDEYDAFVGTIREIAPDIRIDFLPADTSLTIDSLYPRDAAIACNKGMILCHMGKPARAAEPAAERQLFERLGIPIHGEIVGEGRVEGGDVTWINENTLAVGRGYRTNDEGIRQLRELVSVCGAKLVVTPLPHYRGPSDVFHLMSIISPVDTDTALVYSPLMSVPFREQLLVRGIKLIEVPNEEFESMGCNVLAIAPGRCIMVSGNPETRKQLESAGIEVHLIDGQEICRKGEGGPTCLTRPVLRELHEEPEQSVNLPS